MLEFGDDTEAPDVPDANIAWTLEPSRSDCESLSTGTENNGRYLAITPKVTAFFQSRHLNPAGNVPEFCSCIGTCRKYFPVGAKSNIFDLSSKLSELLPRSNPRSLRSCCVPRECRSPARRSYPRFLLCDHLSPSQKTSHLG